MEDYARTESLVENGFGNELVPSLKVLVDRVELGLVMTRIESKQSVVESR